MCTGYMYIRPTPDIITLYDVVSEEGKKRYSNCIMNNNDQTYFNDYVKPVVKWNALPLENYPNGAVFYKNMKESDRILSTAILIHFNWIKGHFKMAKMKEYRMWLLTPEEEEEISF